ncbi:hypothetical protein [Vitreimonas flagellata]|uniref:hypothetical protein n=1 Tax=Vitreimonas flagellata TaxID=2560861 RepID=UPI001074D6AC|nr:hypothetical protein [Vitreimonas flagellata]
MDEAALGAFSKRLASAIFAAFPGARARARMIRSGEADGLSLSVHFPSPSNDAARFIEVWVDEAATPSIGFGPSHTHFGADEAGIAETVELCRAIMSDRVVSMQDVGGEHDGHSAWLDLRDPEPRRGTDEPVLSRTRAIEVVVGNGGS